MQSPDEYELELIGLIFSCVFDSTMPLMGLPMSTNLSRRGDLSCALLCTWLNLMGCLTFLIISRQNRSRLRLPTSVDFLHAIICLFAKCMPWLFVYLRNACHVFVHVTWISVSGSVWLLLIDQLAWRWSKFFFLDYHHAIIQVETIYAWFSEYELSREIAFQSLNEFCLFSTWVGKIS